MAVESVSMFMFPRGRPPRPSSSPRDSIMAVCVCVSGLDCLGHGRGQVFHGEGYGIMQNISALGVCVCVFVHVRLVLFSSTCL